MVHVAWRRYYGLAVENAFKIIVPRPRYACTPTEVHMYPDRGIHVPRPGSGQTHQNYSDKNCNISNCKTLIINVLDLLILDIFRIFIV